MRHPHKSSSRCPNESFVRGTYLGSQKQVLNGRNGSCVGDVGKTVSILQLFLLPTRPSKHFLEGT